MRHGERFAGSCRESSRRRAAQSLVGDSDRVESGLVDAYVATYSPEHQAGYYAVTTDQGLSFATATALAGSVDVSSADQTVLVFSRYSSAQIESSLADIRGAVEAVQANAAFYYEPAIDGIILTVDARHRSGRFSMPTTAVEVHLDEGLVSDGYFAENMRTPFRGGGTLYDLDGRRCTSGIPAYNASGTPGYFTAAHCYDLGENVYSSSWHSGASITGSVTHRYSTQHVDAEFVSGGSYIGHVFVADSSSLRVAGTYFPAAGVENRLCFSGSTTGKKCDNNLITYQGEFCGTTGCNSDHIALRGGTSSQGGDSGGPAYATFGSSLKVSGIVRGHKDPLVGESTTFVVDWRKIAYRYSATLMTG